MCFEKLNFFFKTDSQCWYEIYTTNTLFILITVDSLLEVGNRQCELELIQNIVSVLFYKFFEASLGYLKLNRARRYQAKCET